jgi:sarcosine oxidase subunit gamma
VFSAKHNATELEKQLADALGDTASLFDQTHGRFVVRISGDDATRLLAKGTSLDLDEGVFLAQGASHATIEHLPALVVRRATPVCFELSVPRSYAGSLLAWFTEAAEEFGYSVETSI